MELNQNKIEDLVKKVMAEMTKEGIPIEQDIASAAQSKKVPSGFYDTVDSAVEAAYSAQAVFASLSLEKRHEIIESIRLTARDNAEMLGELAVQETKLGKMPDKMHKVLLAARKTPGVEDIEPYTFTGDHGLTLVERAPYGVIASVTPSTNPPSTVINNSISILSAGNAVVFNPHPSAKEVSQKAISLIKNGEFPKSKPSTLIQSLSPTKM